MEDIIPLKDIKTDRNTQNNEQPSQSSEVADERPKMRSYFSIEVESEDDLDSFDEVCTKSPKNSSMLTEWFWS